MPIRNSSAELGYSPSAVEQWDSHSSWCVRVARTADQVRELRDAWELLQWHPNADFDFYSLIGQSRKGILRPHVISVARGGSIAAILVGRLELRSIEAKLGYFRFKFPAVPCISFVYGGFMGNESPEIASEIMASISQSLRQREATLVAFNSVEANSPLAQLVLSSPGLLLRDHVPVSAPHRSTKLPETYAELLQGISSKSRKNLKWQAKKLLADSDGEVSVRCYREPSQVDELVREVESVAQHTYQRALGVGFLDDSFTRERLRLCARYGGLRAFVLYLRNEPSAFWIGTVYRNTFHSDFMGYSSKHGKYSPGAFLLMKAIEHFYQTAEAGEVTSIDFGLGDAQYKEVLGDECWQELSMFLFAPTMRGVALNLARTPITLLNQVSVWFLNKTAFLSKIRKLWRQRRQLSLLKPGATVPD